MSEIISKSIWYEELGFKENPFSIKPFKITKDIFGYDTIIQEINRKIKASSLVFVVGDYGTGKTAIMKGIVEKYGGKKKVIYYNCSKSEKSIDFDKLLINAGGFLRRLFKKRKKGMILLVDEAQDMNIKDGKQIQNYYIKGFFSSIVFVGTKKDIGLPQGISDLLSGNVYTLTSIDKSKAVELARSRIGDLDMISDKVIINIYEKNSNPRNFLKNCEKVFRFAFDNGKKKILKKDIEKALNN